MLQAAYGGNFLIDDSTTNYVLNLNYYEAGFNFMSPLEISIPQSDRFFILIRKRVSDQGDGFDNLIASNVTVSAVDATNGENIVVRITNNDLNIDSWNENPSTNTPVLLQIESQLDMIDSILRVRVIDCKVVDNTDDSFISFRIIVEDNDATSLYFNYLPVHRKIYSDRNSFSSASREAYITLRSDSDAYLLVSPYAWIKEVDKAQSDFSYPLDTFYYQRETTYNNEDFNFSLSSWSHSFITDHVSILNIPSYKKAAIILMDHAIYKNIRQTKESVTLTMSINGELSGIEDALTVNLYT